MEVHEEYLKHPSVEKVIIAEIDSVVILVKNIYQRFMVIPFQIPK